MLARHPSLPLVALSLTLCISACASSPTPRNSAPPVNPYTSYKPFGPAAQYDATQLQHTGRTTVGGALAASDPDLTVGH